MKKLFLIFLILTSCVPYQSYITVNSEESIEYGKKEIIVSGHIEQIKYVLSSNMILYKIFEGGIETEEILIDEGTRAKYKIYDNDDKLVITCFWGITQKVKSNMSVIVGHNVANSYSTSDWNRATYEKGINGNMSRPGKVFMYGYQLAKQINTTITLK